MESLYETIPSVTLYGYHLVPDVVADGAADPDGFVQLICSILLTLTGFLLRAHLIAQAYMLLPILFTASMKASLNHGDIIIVVFLVACKGGTASQLIL